MLARGYAIATRPDGELVADGRRLAAGGELRLRLRDGVVGCAVTTTSEEAASG